MTTCKGFIELMKWQADRIREAISEDKWYLSEQAGHDVGHKAAENNFQERHLVGLATDWRRNYCGGICDHRDGCPLGLEMVRISTQAQSPEVPQ